jgi:hypothetical protein
VQLVQSGPGPVPLTAQVDEEPSQNPGQHGVAVKFGVGDLVAGVDDLLGEEVKSDPAVSPAYGAGGPAVGDARSGSTYRQGKDVSEHFVVSLANSRGCRRAISRIP